MSWENLHTFLISKLNSKICENISLLSIAQNIREFSQPNQGSHFSEPTNLRGHSNAINLFEEKHQYLFGSQNPSATIQMLTVFLKLN